MKITPIVKWAGGKRQIINELLSRMPTNYNRYFEPFIGGGALLLSICPKNAYISDLNAELIAVYHCLKDNDLFELFKKKLIEYENKHSEEFYYEIRALDQNEDFSSLPIYVKAARMIYLNKAGFNGLYRVNKKGFFNVPSSKKTKVTLFDNDNLIMLHEYFSSNNIEIKLKDFSNVLKLAQKNDFVYFDPPYDQSFTSYTKNNFNQDEQIRLCNVAKELNKKGVFVMISNHNTPLIRSLYKDFHIDIIHAKRMINSDASNRGEVEEVIIRNYE